MRSDIHEQGKGEGEGVNISSQLTGEHWVAVSPQSDAGGGDQGRPQSILTELPSDPSVTHP